MTTAPDTPPHAVAADADDAPPPAAPPPQPAGLPTTLAAMWIAVVSAKRAGRIVGRSNALNIAIACVVSVIATVAAIFALLTVSQLFELRQDVFYGWDDPISVANRPSPDQPRTVEDVLHRRSIRRVWDDPTNSYGGATPVLIAVVATLVPIMLGVVLLLPIVILPRIYKGGAAWKSLAVAYRVPAVAMGPAIFLCLLVGAITVIGYDLTDGVRARGWVDYGTAYADMYNLWMWDNAMMLIIIGMAAISIWRFVSVAQRIGAAAIVTAGETRGAVGMRCINCGYSLAHVPEGGRCPECGESTERSLSAETRVGLAWQTRKRAAWRSGLATMIALFLRPKWSHRRALTRSAERSAWRFERWQYTIGVVVTYLAILLMTLAAQWYTFREFLRRMEANAGNAFLLYDVLSDVDWVALLLDYFIPCAATAVALVLFIFLVHRLLAGIAVMIAAVKGDPNDARALASASGFECVFGWSFLLFNVTFFMLLLYRLDEWLRNLGERLGYEMPWSFSSTVLTVIFFSGNALLAAIWIRRLRTAYLGVRWANF